MRKIVFISLLVISVILLLIRFGAEPVSKWLNLSSRAGVRVQSMPETRVFIDDKEFGKTPFQDENLAAGEKLVELKGERVSWKGYVKLNAGTLTVVNRELSENQATSSGEVITLESGRGAFIISNPDGAEVEVDSKYVGKTPVAVEDLKAGEHTFLIGHSNFLKRSIKAVIIDKYRLNLNVDLALSEPDLTKIQTEPLNSTAEVVVKNTPTGFLRVRESASTNAKEVGRVSPGENLVVLEELANWYRVKLKDGKEGYVSSQYVEKKDQ